jgi:hypothetical protein
MMQNRSWRIWVGLLVNELTVFSSSLLNQLWFLSPEALLLPFNKEHRLFEGCSTF